MTCVAYASSLQVIHFGKVTCDFYNAFNLFCPRHDNKLYLSGVRLDNRKVFS